MGISDKSKTKGQLLAELARCRKRVKQLEQMSEASARKHSRSRSSVKKLLGTIEELNRNQRQVVQHDRLHSLGEMASGIVHDFNNALTPILGASDFLIRTPEMLDRKPETITLLESIRTAAQDAQDVVSRLKEFYRPDKNSKPKLVDVNPLVEQVVLFTQPKWKDQAQAEGRIIKIKVQTEKIPPVYATESNLREVLTNLVFNAVDAMPQGGTVRVETCSDGDYVVVRVGDTGTGMSAETARRCFEPFYSTKGKDGSGLGLATACEIISKYNGTITANSELGRGTTMIIRLPGCVGGEANAEKVEFQSQPDLTLRILVADDNSLSLDAISMSLVADGHMVETGISSRDVLAKCESTTFDLVLLDRIVPGMTVRQLASAIKKGHPRTRIIMMTGYEESTGKNGKRPRSIDAVLLKPATQVDLRTAVVRAMAARA
jgi:signal transduction histidine kinase/ActR/RegA family two-component response regulator